MTVDFIELNVNEILSMFKLEGQRIIRVSSNERFDGLDVTEQKMVRVGDTRTTTARIKYILIYELPPQGEVVINDLGLPVDIVDNHFRMMLTHRGKHCEYIAKYSGFMGRFTDRGGVRRGKCFDTAEEAEQYGVDMTKSIWSEKASELGFKL